MVIVLELQFMSYTHNCDWLLGGAYILHEPRGTNIGGGARAPWAPRCRRLWAPDQLKIHVTHCLHFYYHCETVYLYQFPPFLRCIPSDAHKCKHFNSLSTTSFQVFLTSTSRSCTFYLISKASYRVTLILETCPYHLNMFYHNVEIIFYLPQNPTYLSVRLAKKCKKNVLAATLHNAWGMRLAEVCCDCFHVTLCLFCVAEGGRVHPVLPWQHVGNHSNAMQHELHWW